jgi:hypothetical protein
MRPTIAARAVHATRRDRRRRGPWRAASTGGRALALGACLANAADAQGRILGGPGAEYVAAGVSRLSTGALDDRLAARGYPTFGRGAFALSLGGYRILPRGVTLGAEWHGVIQGDEAHAGRTVGLGGGYATVGVGYAAQLSPRVRLHPRLGVGVGGLGLWTEPEEGAAVGFDEVLADPDRYAGAPGERDRETVLSHAGLAVDLGAGAELLARRRGRGPLVGVRLGYLAMPFAPEWRLGDRRVSGGPSATLAGPYVRVMVGTGRRP